MAQLQVAGSILPDAYFNQLNDRYKGKWQEYQNLSRLSMGQFIATGAGLAIVPLPQPGACATTFAALAGTGGTVYYAVTFVNAGGEESSPSVLAQISIPDGSALVCQAPAWQSNATGWNFYGATAPLNLVRQNVTPLAPGGTWQYQRDGGANGPAPGTGQIPNVLRDLPRRIMRG